MKKLFFLAIVLCACLVSCSKEVVNQINLLGKWKLEELVTNKDGAEVRTPYSHEAYYIFEKDGIVKAITTVGESSQIEVSYTYSISGDNLTMAGAAYKIKSLTGTKMELSAGALNGEEVIEVFSKVN